jgi:nucleoside-diphosphate-sugar epimerase
LRVFVTGASGWIGRGLVPELIAAGHQVTGLARSEDSAEALRAAGAEAYVGDGANRWPSVHRDDAAHLFRLALEICQPFRVARSQGHCRRL